MDQNLGAVPLLGGGARSALGEAYLHTKWHLDPSNHLTTRHQHHRQDRTDNGQTAYRANHFTNGGPKIRVDVDAER